MECLFVDGGESFVWNRFETVVERINVGQDVVGDCGVVAVTESESNKHKTSVGKRSDE